MRSGGRPFLWRLLSNPVAATGAFILVAIVVMALFAPQIAPFEPAAPNLRLRLAPPSWAGGPEQHLLGTDHLGRDILSRLIFGSRIALFVGVFGVTLQALIGIVLGLTAGYFGGWLDVGISRVVDTLLSIPTTILYLTVLGVFGPSLVGLVAVLGAIGWTRFARVVRAETLSVKNREFVEAARALGQYTPLVLLRHVLPSIMAPIIVVATLNVATVIITEAQLSFLGFGVQPPTVTWGRMLADGRSYVATAWWLATFPGIFITLMCLSLIFIGDRLRDVLDPRLRGQ